MTLEELVNMIGAGKDDRNGITRPGIYTPSTTSFESKYIPGAGWDGRVDPFSHSKAEINNGNFLEYDNDPDLTKYLYTAFHEAAHTAQPVSDMYLSQIGLGSTRKLNGNTFPPYYTADGKAPNPLESLATLRGIEAMMPSGTTIWDSDKTSRLLRKDGKADPYAAHVENYLQQTMKKNNMTREGAQRFIDTRMFPEHSLMHSGEDFVPAKKEDWIDTLLKLLK